MSGDGSTDNAAFEVSNDTLKTAAMFDYETKNTYNIRVRSTDSGGQTVDKQFTINIIDVQYATTTTVSSSTNPALLNQAVTFTAQVTAAAGSGIVGG